MMKKYLIILFTNVLISQNFNENFLDGTIMFKLNDYVEYSGESVYKTNDGIGLIENLSNYPEINSIFQDINVLQFERPSYFTNKRELQKIYRIKFDDFDKIDLLIKKLNDLESIEYAEKEPIYRTTFVPNDSYHWGNNKWYHTLVNSEQAWDISLGNENIKIAVVDNAVGTSHLDLSVFKQRDVADNDDDANPPLTYSQNSSWSHGTHCAGLATASINNALGIASLGGNVELIGVKVTPNGESPNSLFYTYNGVQWACANGANIVSMSYGGSGESSAQQDLINAYNEVVFVAAAGNDGNTTQFYPAAYMNVIGVGSVDANDQRSSFSNYNSGFPWVDIASPGGYSYGGLLSSVYTDDLNSYANFGGTSMAAPFAAGLIGLMKSINPSLTRNQIQNCLISSGVDINQDIGPRIDAYAALVCAQPGNNNPLAGFTASPQIAFQNQGVTFSNNSVNGENWFWTFEGGSPSTYNGENPPEIFYSDVGTYDVTLTVSNSEGEQTITKEDYITVYVEASGAWILQNSNFDAGSTGINYLSIVDENVVWGTAFDGSGNGINIQKFTKTTNGGDTWEYSEIDIGNAELGISMIHALDAQTAWLVAYPRGANQIGGIFKTIDGGLTWSRQDSANYDSSSSFANVVYFWDENVGFAQGDPLSTEFELYVTNDGGDNWNAVPGSSIPNPLGGEYGYTRQIEVVDDNVWFSTNNGRIYHSIDRGNNWTVYQSPISDFGSAEVNGNLSFADSQNGVIIDNSGNVYRSTNAGASWTQISTTGPVYTSGLCFIEGTNTIFSTGGGSSFSNDGGYSWNPIDTTTHLYVDFHDENIGWSGGWTQETGFVTVGGVWKWEDFSLDIDEIIDLNELKYFPNPTSGILNISYSGNLIISVFDINGRKLLLTENKTVDFTEFNDGIYIVKVKELNSNFVKHFKIIKK